MDRPAEDVTALFVRAEPMVTLGASRSWYVPSSARSEQSVGDGDPGSAKRPVAERGRRARRTTAAPPPHETPCSVRPAGPRLHIMRRYRSAVRAEA